MGRLRRVLAVAALAVSGAAAYAFLDFSQVLSFFGFGDDVVLLEEVDGTILWEGKTIPTASDYVQDGLVAMWDGIENAGWDTDDRTSTKWVNLCSPTKNTFTVQSGKSWWGEKSFEVNTNYAQNIGTKYFSEISWAAGGSLEVCFRPDFFGNRSSGNAGRVFATSYNNGALQLSYSAPWSRLWYFIFGPATSSTYVFSDTSFVGSGLPKTLSSSVIPGSTAAATTNTIYRNGVRMTISNTATFSYSQSYNCGLCADYTGKSQNIEGGFYCIRVYNRPLTAAEIAWNYSIDKERFNLP